MKNAVELGVLTPSEFLCLSKDYRLVEPVKKRLIEHGFAYGDDGQIEVRPTLETYSSSMTTQQALDDFKQEFSEIEQFCSPEIIARAAGYIQHYAEIMQIDLTRAGGLHRAWYAMKYYMETYPMFHQRFGVL